MVRVSVMSVVAISAFAGQGAFADGSAADLAGLKPVGWPLGVPMTCRAISDALRSSLNESVEKIVSFCNQQNESLRAAGYRACHKNECVDVATVSRGCLDAGQLKLKIGRSEWTDAYYAQLTYTFSEVKMNGQDRRGFVCFDPVLKADELLQTELDSWDYQRFVEFCVAK